MEKIFVRIVFLLCMALLIAVCLLPADRRLESENTYVGDFAFTDESFSLRFPLRTQLLSLNRNVYLSLYKNEFSGAFLGKDGYIFSNEDVSAEILAKNLSVLDVFSGSIDVNLCVIPSKTDVLITGLPDFYESMRGELWKTVGKCKYNIPDVLPTLLLAANNSKYIYYRGDHHLTSLGSYYVYKSLEKTLDIKAFDSDDFYVGVVKSDFSGSDARKMLVKTNDKISLFRYKGDNDFLTKNNDSGDAYSGLYDYDKLNSADPYGIFPVADCGYASIRCAEGREKLLLICDSYGDSLCPFLMRHFDIDMIDVRYFNGSVKELVKEEKYTKALICFGMDTIASKEILYKLSF